MTERLGKLLTINDAAGRSPGVGSLHISTCSYSIHIVRLYLILLMSIMVYSCYAAVIECVSEAKAETQNTPHSSSDLWKSYVYLLILINIRMCYSASNEIYK